MIITKNGITIRLNVADLRVMGRATQGVRLINIADTDEIAAVTKVDHEEDEPSTPIENNESNDSTTDNTNPTE